MYEEQLHRLQRKLFVLHYISVQDESCINTGFLLIREIGHLMTLICRNTALMQCVLQVGIKKKKLHNNTTEKTNVQQEKTEF